MSLLPPIVRRSEPTDDVQPAPRPKLDAPRHQTPAKPVLPLQLDYEKPVEYRVKSTLGPPGPTAKAFWKLCYLAGRMLRPFVPPQR